MKQIGKKTSKQIVKLSPTKIKHVLNRHMFQRVQNQLDYQLKLTSRAEVEKALAKRTFFNKNWSSEKIVDATEQAYNKVLSMGVTNGERTVKVYGENITAILQDGKLSTAYGNFRYTLKDFGY